MFDFKSEAKTSGIKFSDLTDDDLRTITEAEQKIRRHGNSNQVLIAYDQLTETGSGGRS